MSKPLLQIALDTTSYEEAITCLESGVDEVVDIIECGTILLASEGKNALLKLRERYPDKLLCADFKIADSGKVMASLLLEAKPDYMTVICSAHKSTMLVVKETIEQLHPSTKVQLELYGKWDIEDIKCWYTMGIDHVVYHHARDIPIAWSNKELEMVKALCETGMHVTVTGCIGYEEIALFKDIPIYCIICGRSIWQADNPKEEALKLKNRIEELW